MRNYHRNGAHKLPLFSNRWKLEQVSNGISLFIFQAELLDSPLAISGQIRYEPNDVDRFKA